MTRDDIEGAVIYDALVTTFVRAGIYSDEAIAVARQLVLERIYEADVKAALLAFLDAAEKAEGAP